MKFKHSVIILLSVFLSLACVACEIGTDNQPGSGSMGETDSGKQVILKIESAAPLKSNYQALLRSEKEGTKLYQHAMFTKKLVDGFVKKYPNIKLQFIEDGWGEALFQQQQLYIRDYNAGGKMAVDIMIGEPFMRYFAENGVFAELDKSKFADVLETANADVTLDGKIYGVPMCTSICGLQYNTDILKEAGIPEDKWIPASWAELTANCKAVKEFAAANNKKYGGIVMNNVAGMSSAFRVLPFLRQAGGDFVDKNGSLTINSQENIDAFGYLRSLSEYAYADSITCDNEDTLQYYFTNKGYAAYMVEGQWSMADAPDNIKSAALPSKNADGTGVGNVFIGNVLFGITKGSKNKNEAQAFLEYLISDEVQNLLYVFDGRLPINKTFLNSDEIKTIHPNINPYIDQLKAGGFEGGLPSFTKNVNDIWMTWGSFYNNVLTSKKDIKQLADALQADLEAKL